MPTTVPPQRRARRSLVGLVVVILLGVALNFVGVLVAPGSTFAEKSDSLLPKLGLDLEGAVLGSLADHGLAHRESGVMIESFDAACVRRLCAATDLTVVQLVEGIGERRVSVINVPGSLPQDRLAQLGVARVSFGPWTQRLALTAFADFAMSASRGGNLPDGIRPLN